LDGFRGGNQLSCFDAQVPNRVSGNWHWVCRQIKMSALFKGHDTVSKIRFDLDRLIFQRLKAKDDVLNAAVKAASEV
jgi:hypothetical protein